MRRINNLVVAGATLGFFLVAASVSHAQTNFANFNTLTSDQVLLYNNTAGSTGAGSDFLSLGTFNGSTITNASSLNVAFVYQAANGLQGNSFGQFNPILAQLTVTGQNTAGVVGTTQDFTNVVFRFTTTSDRIAANGQFVAAGANLLTVTATTAGGIVGASLNITGPQTGAFEGSQTFPSAANYTIGYSSDFLDFTSATTQRNYSVALNNIVGEDGNTTGVAVDGNGDFESFRASFAGQFGSTPLPGRLDPTPAPPGVVSALIGIAMGGAQFGMVKFRNRRRAKKTEVVA